MSVILCRYCGACCVAEKDEAKESRHNHKYNHQGQSGPFSKSMLSNMLRLQEHIVNKTQAWESRGR